MLLSDLQKSIVGAMARHRTRKGPIRKIIEDVFDKVKTVDHAIKYLEEGDWPEALKKVDS